MPTSIETQGVTVEEAIQVALNQLGVTRDRVEIQILHHPRGGFLGIGARRAKVRATVREGFLADGDEYDMSGGDRAVRGRRSRRARRRGRGRRGESREDEAPPAAARESRDTREPRESRAQPAAAERMGRREGRSRGGRGRGREREGERRVEDEPGRREGEKARGPREQEPAPQRLRQVRPVPGEQPMEPAREPREIREGARPQGTVAAAMATPQAGEELATLEGTWMAAERERTASVPLPVDEVQHRAQEIVAEVLRRMGLHAEVSSVIDEAEGEVVIQVNSDADGLLIGRRGQSLDALEHLVNRMIVAGDTTAETRIAIDVGGYRDRRRDALLELADRLKVRALTQGRRIQVSPMSPRDRRILQAALARDQNVRARVLGTGFYRRVVISPVGLDEESSPLEVGDDVASAGVETEEENA